MAFLSSTTGGILLCFALFCGMLIALETGRRLGKRRLGDDPDGARSGLGTVEGALFGLLGLIIAFSFGGAATRYDERRDLIVEEANAISTAWSRVDLVPASAQPAIREPFRRYVDARLAIYAALPDIAAAQAALQEANLHYAKLWAAATAACHLHREPDLRIFLLPPLNAMSDIATARIAALYKHPPTVIFVMLFSLSLVCSVLAGYGMAPGARRGWTHMIGFALVISIVIYVILDLEYPRTGLIRLDDADRPMVEVRAQIN